MCDVAARRTEQEEERVNRGEIEKMRRGAKERRSKVWLAETARRGAMEKRRGREEETKGNVRGWHRQLGAVLAPNGRELLALQFLLLLSDRKCHAKCLSCDKCVPLAAWTKGRRHNDFLTSGLLSRWHVGED
jgi:hypothetical protein